MGRDFRNPVGEPISAARHFFFLFQMVCVCGGGVSMGCVWVCMVCECERENKTEKNEKKRKKKEFKEINKMLVAP